jgi:iron complex transport system substrate-binding protein
VSLTPGMLAAMGRHHRSIGRALAVAALVVVAVAGCGGTDGGREDGGSSSGAAGAGDATGASGDGLGTERVLALGEERLLADLLALGIRPMASSANVVIDDGFVGFDPADVEGIQPLLSTDPNIEALAALEPEVVVASEFVVGELGRDVLDGLGTVVVVPGGDAAEQILALGDAFDRRDEAEALVAEHEAAIEEGRAAVAALPEESRTVSVATIYPGPTVAAWVDGPVDVPATLLDLGFTLQPGPADVSGAESGATDGRAYLSEEQLGLFDAPTIVAMQSEYVEGEDEALAAMAENPLWIDLPAVRSDRVVTVDRLGYPGITGHIRLVDDLTELLGE